MARPKQWWQEFFTPRGRNILTVVALTLIVGVSLWLRLYGLQRPLADWHSFRQADTASVTREYLRHGIDPLRPRYHDVSNIQSGKENPEGWRMVEFPLLNILAAGLLQMNPDWSLVVTHRVISIVSSLISLVCLSYLAWRWYGRLMSAVTATIFGLMPFNVYYSRVILPEPFMVMWALLGACALEIWARRSAGLIDAKRATWISLNDGWLVLSAVAFSLALLVKPVALFFIPLYILVAWRWRRWQVLPWVKAGVLFALAVLPLYWWRQWIQEYPEGVPAALWLLNENGIRFRPAWWRWLFADRIGRMMFGHWGAAFLAVGGVATLWQWPQARRPKQNWLLWLSEQKDAWLRQEGLVVGAVIGAVAFLVVFATGNVQHDYYQTVIVPALALLAARGVVWLVRQAQTNWQRTWMVGACVLVGGFSWIFAWYDIQQLFNINNPAVVPAGEAVQRLTPPDSLVIAHYLGDTTLLFATERRGWPIGYSVEQKRQMGAEFFVSTAYDDETSMLAEMYPVLERTDLYTVIDLRQPKAATESGDVNQ